MIIVCYDGCEDAQAAADHVTRAFRGKPATVLTVWEPYAEVLASSELGLGSGFGVGYDRDTAGLDAQLLERAQKTAEEGARRLRAAGMGADALVEASDGSIARTVLAGGNARRRRGGRRRDARTRPSHVTRSSAACPMSSSSTPIAPWSSCHPRRLLSTVRAGFSHERERR